METRIQIGIKVSLWLGKYGAGLLRFTMMDLQILQTLQCLMMRLQVYTVPQIDLQY